MPKPKTPMQANGFSLLVPVAALIVLLAGGDRPAQAFIDFQLPTLYEVVKGTRLESGVGDKTAFEIAVLKVEKVNREKKAITYRKVRDLKGTFPGPNKQIADTFTHILREVHNPTFHTWDKASGMVYGSPVIHRGRLNLATCNLGEKTARTQNVVVCIGEK
jgi:hypothetical protein